MKIKKSTIDKIKESKISEEKRLDVVITYLDKKYIIEFN